MNFLPPATPREPAQAGNPPGKFQMNSNFPFGKNGDCPSLINVPAWAESRGKDMPRPQKRCKFIDDSAELSGDDIGEKENEDENNIDEPTKEDLDFVDDSSQKSDDDSKISKAKNIRLILSCISIEFPDFELALPLIFR